MSELHQKLKESIRELEQIRKIQEHTAQLQERLIEETRALQSMELMLSKEQKDVETLEREGLTTMFRKFIGDREEKLEKEREEYLKASLRFNELYKSVELIRFELDLLSKKEQNKEGVERRIVILMKDREKELLQLNDKAAEELKGIHQQSDRLHAYEVEIGEAYEAGSIALEYIRGAENSLVEAQRWGQRDMWGGHHRGAGHLKHQAIDQARNMAHQSRHALIRFGNELRDVYKDQQLQFNIDIEEFGRFTDVFFDNLITDWMVQQKINKSLTNVSSTRQQIEAIVMQLSQELGQIKDKLEALEVQRKKVILESA
jgi:hypothetical protein